MKHWRRNLTRLLIGSFATGAFLWLFLREAHLGEAWREIRRLPGWSMLASLGLILVNISVMTLRWRYLFSAARVSISARELLPTVCVGRGANNILPARGGDLLRIESVREMQSVPAFVVAGTLFAERLLDGVVLAAWIVLGALLLGESGPLLLTGVALSAGTALGVVLVGLAARQPVWTEQTVWRVTRRLPPRWHGKIGRATANFVDGLGAFRARTPLVRVLWTSAVMWLVDVAMYAIVGRAFGIDLGLGAYFLLEGIGNLALAVPTTAAGLGTFDYLTLVAAKGVDVPETVAAGYVLTMHALSVIPVTILGVIFMRRAFPRVFGAGDAEHVANAYKEV